VRRVGLAGAWFSLLRHRLEIEEARVNGERGREFAWRKHMDWWCADRRTPSMALCAAARAGSRHQRDQRVCPACGGSCGRARRGTSAIETQDATLAARIDVQTHNVADLDRRLGQIDSAIEEAAKRGKTNIRRSPR
jgi:hypothetical protein